MHSSAEWLEPDGLGGFASGCASGIRSRRYHALLLAATTPPTGRVALVNDVEAWLEIPEGKFPLSSHRYAPDVVYPDGAKHLISFDADPWPRWTFALPGARELEHGIIVQPGRAATVVYWRMKKGQGGALTVRLLMSGRDYHSMHHENPAFNFAAEVMGHRVIVRPYQGIPGVVFQSRGTFNAAPQWFRNFLYTEERARGLDCIEDLASPGTFSWDLTQADACLMLSVEGQEPIHSLSDICDRERERRAAFPSRLHRAADSYIVKRDEGKTIVAGYPWFTDWGRDTFIAMRGLCLATGRHADARDILLQWAGAVSEGMLPNRFPDRSESPEYNAVDASLWFIVAAHEFIRSASSLAPDDRQALVFAAQQILHGYSNGTRFGIKMDADGLLACGQPGVQLTWMDAKVGDWVVTPRIGKPVEVQALWLNALRIGGEIDPRWMASYNQALVSFRERFWNAQRGCLYDVVDCDHRAGAVDASLRPNQIFAVGGLPFPIIEGEQAARIVQIVEAQLYTPIGLRSLAPTEPGYAPRYEGDVRRRDGAYHQGTVWPWLMGGFVDAWLKVRGYTDDAKREARERFLVPLLARLDDAGIGHLPEIADATEPYLARGCFFQAWSVGEALRIESLLK